MSSEKPPVVKAKVGFFKLFTTSCLGTIFALGLIVGGFVLGGQQLSKGMVPVVKPNTVLKLSLNEAMPELSNNTPQDQFDPESLFKESIGLSEMCRIIEHAKDNSDIKGIYLDLSGVPIGWASSKVLRDKLIEFKEADKFIIAYGNYYSQKSYYFASVADKAYLYPEGGMEFFGFAGQFPFFKGAMEKAGVEAQIFYVGDFKSATEPFRLKSMSAQNRRQVTEYLGGMYDLYLEDLAASRAPTKEDFYRIANEGLIRKPADAVTHKLIDATKYKDEVLDELRELLGTDEDDEIEVATPKKYLSVYKDDIYKFDKTNKIAVVYAEGSIVDGEGDLGSIGGEKYARIIRKIRKDDKVKAIVMRVNSGGGSALASDIIWRELEMAKKQGIKVVTSMGDVAASGGYYIASNSERIFAQDRTITGSIGVFGMLFNMRELLEDKMGVTMDTVRTGEFSMLSQSNMYFKYGEKESRYIQESVEEVYDVFKTRVSDGRGFSKDSVHAVAQGRVWLGNKALEIGLVDELGGLDEAVAYVAKSANLEEDDYRTVAYPKTKSFQERLLASFGQETSKEEKAALVNELKQAMTPVEFRQYMSYMQAVKQIQEMEGVQMRLPYTLDIQ
ncbi:MAG: signal peptide peptidase SppA [Aureispira sp.]